MPESDSNKLPAIATRTPANLRYFLDRIDDPGWIDALEEEGVFATPPAVETTEDDEGTWLRFPDWPASRYLARVAGAAPQRVAEVLLGLNKTDNVRVHADIVAAAVQMPVELADRVAERELKWFAEGGGPLLNYPAALVDLGTSLFGEGRRESARLIFNAVLELHRDDSHASWRWRVSARLSEDEYGGTLAKISRVLIENEGVDGLRFLAERLQDAVELNRNNADDDLSYIWRPAIADHDQNVGLTVLDALVVATRDAAVAVGVRDPEGVVEMLKEFQTPIFTRLLLYVLKVLGDRLPQLAADALLDRENLEDVHLWHEYAELLRARFDQLSDAQRERLLGLFDEGPIDQEDEDTADAEARRASRRYRRLAVIADHLTGEALAHYEELVTRYGPPDHPEFLSYSMTWTGPTSPITRDQVRALAPAHLVAFLNDWQAEETFGPHATPEGLGRLVSEVVADTPEPYAAEALRFIGCEPTYVRALLGGLEAAAKAGRSFDWHEPLELARWVVGQVDVEQLALLDVERDANWSWTRKQVARLLGRGLETGSCSISADFRSVVWSLLAVLTQDPDPAQTEERDDGGMDPATLSLNVTRGEAMHSVVRYAIWLERLEGESFQGLESVPEVRAVLERHLDLEFESSSAVRAVYGMWLAQLVRLDEHWVEENSHLIFPADPEESRLFDAAWGAYVMFTRPWLAVFAVIEPAYALAVERLTDGAPDRNSIERPDEMLAEHLVWYTVKSAIPIEDAGLWRDFWDRAPQHLHKHAVMQLGRMLEHAAEVPAEVRERVEHLWEWITSHVAREERSATLSQFGWLLSAKELDAEWLLRSALALLYEGIRLDPDFVVWAALARTVEVSPADSAVILRMMIQSDADGLAGLGYEETIRHVLEAALSSGDLEARRRAKDSVNLLGARGMHSFRDIAETLLE